MTKLIGISGSLRQGSFNSALLQAAAGLAPGGTELTIATIRGIPLYDGDLEAAEGIPEPVKALKEAIVAADGLLLATPEYNNSIPGVFKNAIDWLSRPPADIKRVFGGMPDCAHGSLAGRVRHHPKPERVASGVPHLRRRILVREISPRLAGARGVRRARHLVR